MSKTTSLLLDIVRFLAAMIVFFEHAGSMRMSGGLLWQLGSFAADAVTIFFVLSGFVIAHATATRETSFSSYAIARLSRIYSVALPALIITVVTEAIGRSLHTKGLYDGTWHNHAAGGPVDYGLSVLFLNQIWTIEASPGGNWPYWSLGYEVWYYAIFAALLYLRGRRRVCAAVALLCFVGPGIAVMFPLWLLGVGCYRLCLSSKLRPKAGLMVLLISSGAGLAYEAYAWRHGRFIISDPQLLSVFKVPDVPSNYIVGLIFAGILIGFGSISPWIEPHLKGNWRIIRWTAGATFSLYLFHLPLLRLLAAVSPWPPESWPGRLLVIGGTLVLVFAAAQVTERRKNAWRRALSAILAQIPRTKRRKARTGSTAG